MRVDLDQRLLAELRRDGRASLSDLRERMGLSRATLRSRRERLSARGEIAGFRVLTRSDWRAMARVAPPLAYDLLLRAIGPNNPQLED